MNSLESSQEEPPLQSFNADAERPAQSVSGAARNDRDELAKYLVMVKEDGLEIFLKKLVDTHTKFKAAVTDTMPSFDMFIGNFDDETAEWLRTQPEVLSIGKPERFEFLEDADQRQEL